MFVLCICCCGTGTMYQAMMLGFRLCGENTQRSLSTRFAAHQFITVATTLSNCLHFDTYAMPTSRFSSGQYLLSRLELYQLGLLSPSTKFLQSYGHAPAAGPSKKMETKTKTPVTSLSKSGPKAVGKSKVAAPKTVGKSKVAAPKRASNFSSKS
jgi:hypothetical protein